MDAVRLVAVGGVRRENLTEYLDAGAEAVGVGNSLFGEDALRSKDADAIFQQVSEYLASI